MGTQRGSRVTRSKSQYLVSVARDYDAIFSKLNLRVFIANYTRRRRCQRLRDCVTCTVRVSVTVRVHVSVRGCNTASTLRHAMSSSDHRIVGLSIGLPQIVRYEQKPTRQYM